MTILSERVLGIVLAGGKSQRMGCDKSRLAWWDADFITTMQSILKQAGCAEVLISGGESGIIDQFTDFGPLAGLYSVLNHPPVADYLRVLVVPVDMPMLDASSLRPLLIHTALCDAVHYEGHYLPLVLRKNAASMHMLSELMNASEASGRSFRTLLSGLNTQILAVSDDTGDRLNNINTPADYAACRAASGQALYPQSDEA